MAYKFKVGQAVKFIDCEKNKYSPPHGSIGTVLKVGAIGVDYLVEFPNTWIPEGCNFWYHEDELEAVVDGKEYEYAYSPMPNSKRICVRW